MQLHKSHCWAGSSFVHSVRALIGQSDTEGVAGPVPQSVTKATPLLPILEVHD